MILKKHDGNYYIAKQGKMVRQRFASKGAIKISEAKVLQMIGGGEKVIWQSGLGRLDITTRIEEHLRKKLNNEKN